jgi:hypothetical protein
MPTLQLTREESEQGPLPQVCMECGQPAEHTVVKSFTWHPSWTILFLLFGLLPGIIVIFLTEQKCKLKAPFCSEHKNHWSRRNRVATIGFFTLIVLLGAAFGLMALIDDKQLKDTVTGFVCFGWLALAVVWLIISGVVQSKAISATEVTKESIFLKNVWPEFDEALRKARAEERARLMPPMPVGASTGRARCAAR